MNTDPLAGQLFRLPEAGASARSIGEAFTPNLFSGTGTYIAKLDLPDGIAGFQPELQLTYSTGSPNGPLGMGWQIELIRIDRVGSLGIPTFTENDDLLLGGQPLIQLDAGRSRPKVDSAGFEVQSVGEGYVVRDRNGIRYRQAVQGKTTQQLIEELGGTDPRDTDVRDVIQQSIYMHHVNEVVASMDALRISVEESSKSADRLGSKVFWLNVVLAGATVLGVAVAIANILLGN
ncbi:MAG: hypothetical protein CL878_13680 [Dehalococcoidia bacterium]|nr:hypothetical protein [Dehalococcoidia bacterium]